MSCLSCSCVRPPVNTSADIFLGKNPDDATHSTDESEDGTDDPLAAKIPPSPTRRPLVDARFGERIKPNSGIPPDEQIRLDDDAELFISDYPRGSDGDSTVTTDSNHSEEPKRDASSQNITFLNFNINQQLVLPNPRSLTPDEETERSKVTEWASSLLHCFEKHRMNVPDAVSAIKAWISSEVLFSGWSTIQSLRASMMHKDNSSIPGSGGQTIGPESMDMLGCGSLFSVLSTIGDSRTTHAGFEEARLDLKKAERSLLSYVVAQTTLGRVAKAIDDVQKHDGYSDRLREQLLQDLRAIQVDADRKSCAAMKAVGSLSAKERTREGRSVGFLRDAILQPIQGVNNLLIFLAKVFANGSSAVKELLGPAITIMSKVGSGLGLVAGTFQTIQGAIDTHAALKKSQCISDAKRRGQTAVDTLRRSACLDTVSTLGEQIHAHFESERKTVRQTNRWERAIGIVRALYGIFLKSVGILTLALPLVAPIMVLFGLFLSATYLGWVGVRVGVLRHRKKRLDKEKMAVQREYDLIMRDLKPQGDAKDMKAFWANPRYLKNRLFALDAAAHYLNAEQVYDEISGTDSNGLTKGDRDVLTSFLAGMGVPLESFDRSGTLRGNLAYHLFEDGAFKPAMETAVQWAVEMLGKDDLASRATGMHYLHAHIDPDKAVAQNDAIKAAFHAEAKGEREDAARKLLDLFQASGTAVAAARHAPENSRSGPSGAPAQPHSDRAGSEVTTAGTDDDQMLVCPAALDDYIRKQNNEGRAADADAALALFKKMRGYPLEGVMKSLKSFRGSVLSAQLSTHARFDRVSPDVARIALDESLRLSSNQEVQAKREALVDFCAYAVRREGMVERFVFNHKVHPDFKRLVSVIDGAIKGNPDAAWLVTAIEGWPTEGDEQGRQKFWNGMKLALRHQKNKSAETGLVDALKSDPESATMALNWLVPGNADLIESWKAHATTRGTEVAEHIEHKLGLRKYMKGTFDWLESAKPATPLETLGKLVKDAPPEKAIGAIVDFLSEAAFQKSDLHAVVEIIAGVQGFEGTHKAQAKADLKMRVGRYRKALVAARQEAAKATAAKQARDAADAENANQADARFRWIAWIPKRIMSIPNGIARWSAERGVARSEERMAANRDFIADDLAAAFGRPDLRANHPISPDFLDSLKKLGKKNPAAANQFLRGHYGIADKPATTGPKAKTGNSSEAREDFATLLRMANKVSAWADTAPSIGDLHAHLQADSHAKRSAASCYLAQGGISLEDTKQIPTEKKDFEADLYERMRPRLELGEVAA